MTTYKELKGTNIQAVSSDPSNPIEGQVWYNTTSNVTKGQAATTAGAWASGGNLGTARYYSGSAGVYTSGLVFGGEANPGVTGATETYDGTSFSEVNDLNTTRYAAQGAGASSTSAVAFGGSAPSVPGNTGVTESWNGSNWTEVNDMNTARRYFGGFGATYDSAIAAGGYTTTNVTVTESWNGTNWTEVNDLNTARRGMASAGQSNTAGLIIGGGPPALADTESWNGTNWTEVNNLNTARAYFPGNGTQTSALVYGGTTFSGPRRADTESWNGTNWTEEADLSTGRDGGGGFNNTNNSNAVYAGGHNGTVKVATTEEWTGAGAGVTRTFTDS